MLSNTIGKTIKFVAPRGMRVAMSSRMMATAIDPRGLSPDPPKPGKPRVKGWDRATFTIKVYLIIECLLMTEWTRVPRNLIWCQP
jgi:hypothetical protein